jgi:hypothetical protein
MIEMVALMEKIMFDFTLVELGKGCYKITGKYFPDDMTVTVKKKVLNLEHPVIIRKS